MRLLPGFLSLLLGVGVAAAGGPPSFSGKRAYAHVRALVAFGPRAPGSQGIQKARAYLRRELRQAGVDVEEVKFVAQTPRGAVSMTNLVAKIAGKHTDIVVLGGHYDTVDTRRIPNFVGANDGGSSAAVLLELARVLAARRNDLSIWVVFFDGEEALRQYSARDGFYGSRYLAERWRQQGILPRIRAFILLDMIGDRDLRLPRGVSEDPDEQRPDIVERARRRLALPGHVVLELELLRRVQGEDHPSGHRSVVLAVVREVAPDLVRIARLLDVVDAAL
ncbi:MAG: M28 family peptidase, partial [Terriglobia bacterium]